jgi:2-desacetyl-2-hydroxyethyl bacteriochlorophyllide A dehydrogenase
MIDRLWQRPPLRESLSVAFTAKDRVELLREPVDRPKRGQVTVKTRCSLISTGTERTCLERRFAAGSHWDRWVEYPFRPGYSTVGVVEEVGKGVRTLQPGDRVASHGSHAQYVLVAESDATIVPDAVRDEEAAWFAIACIVQIAFRRASIKRGDTAVIIGTGILGQLAVQYARRAGAAEVVGVGRSLPKLQAAASHGATHIVELHAEEAVPRIQELTKRRGADLVLDVTGSAEVLRDALRMAKPLGTVILLGDSGYPEEQRLTGELLLNGLQLVGAHFGNASAKEHAELAQGFFVSVQEGEIRVDDLITDRVDPRDAATAYAKLFTNPSETIGVVFDWTQL